MFEIGIPNFIKTSVYKSDPLKYNFFQTYNRGKYTLLVSHKEQFFSFLDIASTLKKFKILSLFMIIAKKNDTYTFLIGNSFYPYEKTLLNKSVIKKDENFEENLEKTKQLISMIKKMLNSQNIIIFPIDIDEDEIKELFDGFINYEIRDITKYLLLTPITQPPEKLIVPIGISLLIFLSVYFINGYVDDYFKYTYKPKVQRVLSKNKKFLKKEKAKLKELIDENKRLKSFLKNKENMKVYRGN